MRGLSEPVTLRLRLLCERLVSPPLQGFPFRGIFQIENRALLETLYLRFDSLALAV